MTRVLVVGAGIVGLATAYRLRNRCEVTVVEKEAGPALHQTGRNSGVIHSGIYYKPGSLKARTCREGRAALLDFCREEKLEFDLCGKVIVATRESQLPRLETLFERALANGVACRRLAPEELRELEPHCRGVSALHVPEAGIVDYRRVAARMAQRIEQAGHRVLYSCRVTGFGKSAVETTRGPLECDLVVNCGGLHSDRLTRLSGTPPRARIVPFKGVYYELTENAWPLCRTLIYPVPDPAFPFLGVHFTRMISGGVECGPNAVLALGREAYGRCQVQPHDLLETLVYPGFWRLVARHWRMGLEEAWRTVSKAAFVRALQELVPALRADHLVDAPSGIRAQALLPDGALVDDFLVQESGKVINVCNAPSPAATASLAIGETIARLVTP